MSEVPRSAIVILADGARSDIFQQMLESDELPEIKQHVSDRGGFRRATSTFTSTTIPAHLPFLTGRFAGSANVPGYRWFDRSAHRAGLPPGPWCFRSYNGPESQFVNRDIDADATTIFELVPDSINIFGAITRGVGRANNLGATRKKRLWLEAHFREDYISADEAARELLVESLDAASPFTFAVMPGIDWNSHYDDPFGAAAYEAYRQVDRCVGAVARKLERLGRYEDTLLAIVSDHGHTPVDEHFDVAVRMEEDHGLRVAYHSMRAWQPRSQAICAVSGNAMAHVYFRGERGWAQPNGRGGIAATAPGLIDRLIAEPAIDLVLTRFGSGAALIESEHGCGRVREVLSEDGKPAIEYEVYSQDPFGFSELPLQMSFEQALALTADSVHPDALVQIVQLFRSNRSGDLVVSAAPGYDLRERYERPEHRSSHGALHADHMHVPLAISEPIVGEQVRTADVFNTVLDWLGVDPPTGTDGISRLAETQVESTAEAEVASPV